jgi:hypothetical protein
VTRQFDVDLFVALFVAALLSVIVLAMARLTGGDKGAALRNVVALEHEAQMRGDWDFSKIQNIGIGITSVIFPLLLGYEYFSNPIPSAHASYVLSRIIIVVWVLFSLCQAFVPIKFLTSKNLTEDARTRVMGALFSTYIFILSLIYVLWWRSGEEGTPLFADFLNAHGRVLLISMIVALCVSFVLYGLPYAIGARAAISWSEQLRSFETNCTNAIVSALSRPASIDTVRTALTQIESVADQERKMILDGEGLRAPLDLVSRVDAELQAHQARQADQAQTADPQVSIGLMDAVRHDLFTATLPTDPRYVHLRQVEGVMTDIEAMRTQLERAGADEATVERLGASYARVQTQQIADLAAQGQRKPHLLIAAGSAISLLTPLATKIGSDYATHVAQAVRHILGV